jgi:hypothetical protein
MELTLKQERNGITATVATDNSAVPGPDYTSAISALVKASMNAGVGGPPVVLSDVVVDWETGVAGHEMPGEA